MQLSQSMPKYSKWQAKAGKKTEKRPCFSELITSNQLMKLFKVKLEPQPLAYTVYGAEEHISEYDDGRKPSRTGIQRKNKIKCNQAVHPKVNQPTDLNSKFR